jgi:hypothetical protein
VISVFDGKLRLVRMCFLRGDGVDFNGGDFVGGVWNEFFLCGGDTKSIAL